MGAKSPLNPVHKNILALLLGIGLCVGLIAAAELVLGLWPHDAGGTIYSSCRPLPYKAIDRAGIIKAIPGRYSVTKARKDPQTKELHTIYDVTYTIDPNGHRATPVQDRSAKDRQAVFLGGSFTFGEGLNDHETIPYYFAELAPRYDSYNFGFHGDGPFDILAKSQYYLFDRILKHKNGVIFYIFLNGHIYRAKGSMREMSWSEDRPYYQLASGRLVRKGNFYTGRPVLTTLLRFLSKSRILKTLKKDRILPVTEKDIKITAEAIKATFAALKEKLPGFKAYLVVYPVRPQEPAYYKQVIGYLQNTDISVVDYSGLFDPDESQYHIQWDNHPTAYANRILAERLIEDLNL